MMNVPTFEELKQDLKILEVKPEYDRIGRIKLTGNRPASIKVTKQMLKGTNDGDSESQNHTKKVSRKT